MANGIIRFDEGWRFDEGHHFDEPPAAPPAMPAPAPKPKQKGKHMDFMPKKRAELLLWLKNLSSNAVAEVPKMGGTAGEATEFKGYVDNWIAAMEDTDDAAEALDGKRSTEKAVREANEPEVRRMVRNFKSRPEYPASGSEGVLQLKGAAVGFDPDTYKPAIKATVVGGQIRIDFNLKGADGLYIHCRLKGTPGWQRLALDTVPPYYDTAPLANPAIPEVREYMARGCLDDAAIGLESDIVSVVFAG